MNIGQVLETTCWAPTTASSPRTASNSPTPVASSVFDGATPEQVDEALVEWTRQNPDADQVRGRREAAEGRHCSGKARLFNGRTGEPSTRR